jgi:glyoxylase-like metal-dependent hydrolase (beta-lactamase superfamily II)
MFKKVHYVKIFDRIYLVGRGNWGFLNPLTNIGDSNIFLVDGGEELALIDAGAGLNCKKLIRNIKYLGKDVKKIKKVIITHNHIDHVGGVKILKKKLKIKVYSGFGSYYKNIKISKIVKENDRIKVGDITLKVLSIPGHTPDSIALITKINNKKLVFTGDTAIGDQKKVGKGIVGWYDVHWGSCLEDFKKSIKKLMKLNSDILIPSHGLWSVGKDKVKQSLRNCLKRLDIFSNIPELGTMLPLKPNEMFKKKIV